MAFIPCWPECGHTMGQNSAADCGVCLRQKLEKATEDLRVLSAHHKDALDTCGILRVKVSGLEREADRLKEEVSLLTASCNAVGEEKAEMFRAKESANLQLREAKELLGEFVEGVSTFKTTVHLLGTCGKTEKFLGS